jgi:ABC-type Mn2+/Zn2+ transport system ATPase subunit
LVELATEEVCRRGDHANSGRTFGYAPEASKLSGVPEDIVMKIVKIGGWKTKSMFSRYNVMNAERIRKAMKRRRKRRGTHSQCELALTTAR